MDEFLSLKWNNHASSFLQILRVVKKKQKYTDVTLACSGKFYHVHKIVLSTCSTYFEEIFDQTDDKNLVIVLTNISSLEIEQLLDYMYLGEVHVKQANISSLLKAAGFLQIKGLAVPDDIDASKNTEKVPSNGDISSEQRCKRKETDSSSYDDHESSFRSQKKHSKHVHVAPEVKIESDEQIKPDIWPALIKMESITNGLEMVATQNAIDKECRLDNAAIDPLQMDIGSAHPRTRSSFESCIDQRDDVFSTSFHKEPPRWPSEDSSSSYVKDQPTTVSKDPQRDCEYCGIKMRCTFALEEHLRTHTGERPYACHLCAYRSAQKGNLKRHLMFKHNFIMDR